ENAAWLSCVKLRPARNGTHHQLNVVPRRCEFLAGSSHDLLQGVVALQKLHWAGGRAVRRVRIAVRDMLRCGRGDEAFDGLKRRVVAATQHPGSEGYNDRVAMLDLSALHAIPCDSGGHVGDDPAVRNSEKSAVLEDRAQPRGDFRVFSEDIVMD